MSVRMILLPIFVHVAFVFVLLFWGMRSWSSPANRDGSWRDELALPVLFYLLTICAWQTQLADLLFVVLAWVFVVLRILGAVSYGPGERPSGRNVLFFASAVVLAIMWFIYALRLLVLALR
jgi:hypothetical protein